MPQDRPLVTPTVDESEVDRRYRVILSDLHDLLADHRELLTELDAVVSEMLAEADDRARMDAPLRIGADALPWEVFVPTVPQPLPVGQLEWSGTRPQPCTRRSGRFR